MEKVNKNENKITDKAFFRLMLTSILGILLCIACLCSTTYAWFTQDITHGGNTIQASGECLLTISLDDGTTVLDDVEGTVELEGGKTYLATLTLPKDSPSGYVKITAADKVYLSPFIARHNGDVPVSLSFNISVAETQSVKFETHWGIYSDNASVGVGETLEI